VQGVLAPSLAAGRLDRFLAGHPGAATPFLVVDLDVVRRQYVSLTAALPGTEVFYAVKANPAPEVLSLLIELGSNFDVASREEIELCLGLGADPARLSYADTVIEPWPGFYDDPAAPLAQRTNYALRQSLLAERRRRPGGPTAVSACGANPGMVSWFVKQALLDVADAVGLGHVRPATRTQWAELMRESGVRGIHIAERDTQRGRKPRAIGTFVNTWSVDGFISEGLQPSELGWGTHEKWLPPGARAHDDPAAPSIYLGSPGADTRVRTWCPTAGPQYGLCVTHNESISIADYFTMTSGSGEVSYRPTCHYAYHPADDAMLSWHELPGNPGQPQRTHEILHEADILDGIDELGVLLYGHARNAYWFGSRLSVQETRKLAPYQNATGLQVTSAVLAGMVWAVENADAGIVEADEIDFARCLQVQRPYLGPVEGHFTTWTPLTGRSPLFPQDIDPDDPWQFRNVLVH
jgi:homospermidine synthase